MNSELATDLSRPGTTDRWGHPRQLWMLLAVTVD